MTTITTYDRATGKILTVYDGPDLSLLALNGKSVGVLEGRYDDEEYRVVEGVPVPLPAKPDQWYVFDYIKAQWVDGRSIAEIENEVRYQRERLLTQSDWTQLPDIDQATKDKWQPYRQALRDITSQPGFPENIQWPEPPQ
jgi:hypothetical protein